MRSTLLGEGRGRAERLWLVVTVNPYRITRTSASSSQFSERSHKIY